MGLHACHIDIAMSMTAKALAAGSVRGGACSGAALFPSRVTEFVILLNQDGEATLVAGHGLTNK